MAAAVQRTGLRSDTIRSWERRHRLVHPARSPSGLRAYSEADITRLVLARDATRLGHPIGRVAGLTDDELRRLIAEAGATREEDTTPERAAVARTLAAIERYDFTDAMQALQLSSLTLSREGFALRVAAPLLRSVGASWDEGRIDVAQEHGISRMLGQITGALALQQFVDPSRPTYVFATPPGEEHEFGIALAALIAAGYGNRAILLGTCVPVRSLAQATRRLGADVIVIGTVMDVTSDHLAYVRELRGSTGRRPDIILGGRGAQAAAQLLRAERIEAIESLERFADRMRAA